MLKHFRKDPLESSDPAVRIKAIRELDSQTPDAQLKLLKCIDRASDEAVRLAAIPMVTDVMALADLLPVASLVVSDNPVIDATERRLAELISDQDAVAANTLEQLLDREGTQLVLLVACHGWSDTSRERALKKLHSEKDLSAVVMTSRYHGTRLAASDRLTDVTLMEACVTAVKSRDKAVARALQERLDAVAEKARLAREHQDSINQTLTVITQLAESVWSPQYRAKAVALTERWEKLQPTADEREQFAKAAAVCQQVVEEREHLEQAQAFSRQSLEQANALLQTIQATELQSLGTAIAGFRQDLVGILGGWRISIATVEPDATTRADFDTCQRTITRLLDAAEPLCAAHQSVVASDAGAGQAGPGKAGAEATASNADVIEKNLADALSSVQGESARFIEDAVALQATVNAGQKQKNSDHEARVASVKKQLGILDSTLKEGKWGPARSLHTRIDKKIKLLNPGKQARSLEERLQQLRVRMDELGDWQDFAARPKLEDICTRMESLTEEALPPADAAVRIKTLQDEWKSLGASPAASELWTRFKTASDLAYQPVAQYRDQQKSQREQRTINKIRICDDLDAYVQTLDKREPDWKLVEKTLRQARKEWRDNRITDRKPDRKLENRFTELNTAISSRLDEEYDRNAEAKEALITKITALAAEPVNQHAVNQARRLLTTWKQTGIMRRKQDQALWERFNEQSRVIHQQHRAQERDKNDAALAHVKSARDIIKSLKALTRASEPDEKAFSKLQESFQGLPEFPEKDRKYLFRDFDQASQAFSRLRDQVSARAASDEISELARRRDLCKVLESLMGTDISDSDAESHIASIDTHWEESGVALPKEWEQRILKRRQAATQALLGGQKPDYDEAEQARKMLCIQAEIAADKESPAEDRALRMEYQLTKLQSGLGGGSLQDRASTRRDLEIDWQCLPPVRPSLVDVFDSRFNAVIEQLR